MQIQTLRFELDRLKYTVQQCLIDHQEEFTNAVNQEIENTITEEWVMEEIRKEVKVAIRKSIAEVSDNLIIRRAISNAISKSIVEVFDKWKTN